jgi:hypothetical protein
MSIADEDVFDKGPPEIILPNVQALLDSIKFSPQNAVDMLRLVDYWLARATSNKILDVKIPLLDTSLSKVLSIASVFTDKLFEYFVKAEDFDDRGVKTLQVRTGNTSEIINATEVFHLYVIRGELMVNPSE